MRRLARQLEQRWRRVAQSPQRCSYHSYPDPNELPRVSSVTSTATKQLDKKSPEFAIDSKFRLDVPFPGVPVGKPLRSQDQPKTMSTKLSSGLTVATQDNLGLMSSFAFLVQRGSAHEIQDGSANADTGATHMLELLAFRSTGSRSHQAMMMEMEQLGGMVQCVGSREGILYCVDVLRENIPAAMDILADTILNPQYSLEEIEECKEIVRLQQNELPAELLSRDAVQLAGYRGSPLGNTYFCPESRLDGINEQVLRSFRSRHYHGGTCFVSGAGVEHESFVRLVEKKFSVLAPSPVSAGVTLPPSPFTGGMVSDERALKEPYIKIAIGFEVGGWRDPMLVPTCVLQQLLGGGSSFSAGGPGKGMYTRLYREVLNQHHWVESAEAFVSVHETTGMLGIDGACPPEFAPSLIKVITDQLIKLAFVEVSDEELDRAKNMLKSMMMMQLESRLVLCEDIARQFATYGEREAPAVVCDKIDAVQKQDIRAVAQRMLSSQPAVGAVGHDLSKMPTYEDIREFTSRCRAEAAKQSSA